MAAAVVEKKIIKRLRLSEDIAFQPIDRNEMSILMEDGVGVVENVKILGYSSRNKNRRYVPEGIKPEMYEGKEVYIDHPAPEDQKKPRSINDKFGWVEGVYKTPTGLFAKKFKFDPTHSSAKSFKFWAEKNPRQVGFSQNAFGDVYEASDGELVEEVTEVRSIDLVADPATTKGLFEAYADTEGGEGHTGFEGEIHSGETNPKPKLAPSSPGPSSVVPVEKMVMVKEAEMPLQDDDEEENPGDEEQELQAGEEEMPTDDNGDGVVDQTEEVPGDDMGEEVEPAPTGGPDLTEEVVSAGSKILADPALSMKQKMQRLAHLLRLHHADLEESVKIADFPTAKKVAKGLAKKHKLKSVNMLLEWVDTREVSDAIAVKRETMDKLIKAAKLPDEAITEGFKDDLLECKNDRQMQNKIDDRRKLVEIFIPKGKIKPKSAVGAPDPESMELIEGIRREPRQKKVSKEEQDKRLAAFEDEVFAGVSGFDVE